MPQLRLEYGLRQRLVVLSTVYLRSADRSALRGANMTAALFFVSGDPRPMGSKRAMLHRNSGRVVMFEQGDKSLRSWQGAIREAARSFAQSYADFPLEGPLTLKVNFSLPTPKSKRRKVESGGLLPDVRPDVDKLARAFIDGLTGILFVDDAQIVDLRVTKVYTLTDPGANVALFPHSPPSATAGHAPSPARATSQPQGGRAAPRADTQPRAADADPADYEYVGARG